MSKQTNTKKGNAVIGFILVIAFVWGASSLFTDEKPYSNQYEQSVNNSASLYYSSNEYDTNYSEDDTDYENPYDDGSGHFAGYEWAMENDVSSCGGNSNSFIEGCEEYLSQQEGY